MPDFDTRKPQGSNEPNRVRTTLIANRLRGLLRAGKLRFLSMGSTLRSSLMANKLRTLLIGGILLIVMVAARKVRTRHLLTQDELADKAGLSQSTIANIERNNAEPEFRTIRKLAKALDVDPTELLGD
jgi:DNA-binding XRE family transcriptional regulator